MRIICFPTKKSHYFIYSFFAICEFIVLFFNFHDAVEKVEISQYIDNQIDFDTRVTNAKKGYSFCALLKKQTLSTPHSMGNILRTKKEQEEKEEEEKSNKIEQEREKYIKELQKSCNDFINKDKNVDFEKLCEFFVRECVDRGLLVFNITLLTEDTPTHQERRYRWGKEEPNLPSGILLSGIAIIIKSTGVCGPPLIILRFI